MKCLLSLLHGETGPVSEESASILLRATLRDS